MELAKLEELVFLDNKLTCLKPDVFSGLSECINQDLGYNLISDIEPAAFRGLGKLEKLSLKRNNCTEFQERTWDGLNHLEDLILRESHFTEISSDMWIGLNSLAFLTLDIGNVRNTHNRGFGSLGNLRTLFVAANELTDIKQVTWEGLINLETANNLTTIPPGTFSNLPKLKSLAIGSNDLTTLNEDIFTSFETGILEFYCCVTKFSVFAFYRFVLKGYTMTVLKLFLH